MRSSLVQESITNQRLLPTFHNHDGPVGGRSEGLLVGGGAIDKISAGSGGGLGMRSSSTDPRANTSVGSFENDFEGASDEIAMFSADGMSDDVVDGMSESISKATDGC